MTDRDTATLAGGCHCAAARFEVRAALPLRLVECNCSICRMGGFLHLIVPKADFRLVRGDDALATYRFNTGVAQHRFCTVCGIKPYYVPRSHPDGISVNARCLDDFDLAAATVTPFDGAHWEDNVANLRRDHPA